MKLINEQNYQGCQKAAVSGTLSDDFNPVFIYSITHTELLIAILNGSIDPKRFAERELAARGLDSKGKFVGFKK